MSNAVQWWHSSFHGQGIRKSEQGRKHRSKACCSMVQLLLPWAGQQTHGQGNKRISKVTSVRAVPLVPLSAHDISFEKGAQHSDNDVLSGIATWQKVAASGVLPRIMLHLSFLAAGMSPQMTLLNSFCGCARCAVPNDGPPQLSWLRQVRCPK
eukprot:1159168-Pelagomonas_calceolata.AAC.3